MGSFEGTNDCILSSLLSFPIPTSPLPLGLLQCLTLGHPYYTFVLKSENHDTVSQPLGTSQLHWNRIILAPPKILYYHYKSKGKGRGNMFNEELEYSHNTVYSFQYAYNEVGTIISILQMRNQAENS